MVHTTPIQVLRPQDECFTIDSSFEGPNSETSNENTTQILKKLLFLG